MCQDCGSPTKRKYAKFCDDCRWKHRRKPRKYKFTPEVDALIRKYYKKRGRHYRKRLSEKLGIPKWAIQRRACRLGLTHPQKRKKWTQREVEFLEHHAGKRTPHWMAKQLGRTEASIVLKIKRLKISRKMRGGYTLRQLEACFGEDHKKIYRWVESGWLKVERYGSHRKNDIWRVSEQSVLDFISEHRSEFRLDRVDQEWFLHLALGKRSKSKTCCLCMKPIDGDAVPERRPTGEKGQLETWWYCERCKAV